MRYIALSHDTMHAYTRIKGGLIDYVASWGDGGEGARGNAIPQDITRVSSGYHADNTRPTQVQVIISHGYHLDIT